MIAIGIIVITLPTAMLIIFNAFKWLAILQIHNVCVQFN